MCKQWTEFLFIGITSLLVIQHSHNGDITVKINNNVTVILPKTENSHTMILNTIMYKPVAVWGYTTDVDAIINLREDDMSKFAWKRLWEIYYSLEKHQLCDNKIAIEFVHKYSGDIIFVGYYDWTVTVGIKLGERRGERRLIPKE